MDERTRWVLERYCALGARVADVMGHVNAADCFCNPEATSAQPGWNFQYSEAVLRFIEDAVYDAIAHGEGKWRAAYDAWREEMMS